VDSQRLAQLDVFPHPRPDRLATTIRLQLRRVQTGQLGHGHDLLRAPGLRLRLADQFGHLQEGLAPAPEPGRLDQVGRLASQRVQVPGQPRVALLAQRKMLQRNLQVSAEHGRVLIEYLLLEAAAVRALKIGEHDQLHPRAGRGPNHRVVRSHRDGLPLLLQVQPGHHVDVALELVDPLGHHVLRGTAGGGVGGNPGDRRGRQAQSRRGCRQAERRIRLRLRFLQLCVVGLHRRGQEDEDQEHEIDRMGAQAKDAPLVDQGGHDHDEPARGEATADHRRHGQEVPPTPLPVDPSHHGQPRADPEEVAQSEQGRGHASGCRVRLLRLGFSGGFNRCLVLLVGERFGRAGREHGPAAVEHRVAAGLALAAAQ